MEAHHEWRPSNPQQVEDELVLAPYSAAWPGVLAGLLLPLSGTARAATPTCFGVPATIVGTSGNDVIYGSNGSDVITALGGADAVHGRGATISSAEAAGETHCSMASAKTPSTAGRTSTLRTSAPTTHSTVWSTWSGPSTQVRAASERLKVFALHGVKKGAVKHRCSSGTRRRLGRCRGGLM